MKESDSEYVNVNNLVVKKIDRSLAESFVKQHHYTHKISSSRYTLGLFYRTGEEHQFFSGEHDVLIGCIVYGHPVSNATVRSIFKTISLPLSSVLELTRLVVLDNFGKNIESYFIGQSFAWLKKNDPNVKVLISYADPEQGHSGLIYRATNWYYQGCGHGKLMPDFSVKLEEGGEWIHSRTVGSMFGSRSINNLAKKIGHTFWQKQESPKHRYIYFLCSTRQKQKFVDDLKIPVLPYTAIKFPELVYRTIYVKDGEVTKIEVTNGNDIGWKLDKGVPIKQQE